MSTIVIPPHRTEEKTVIYLQAEEKALTTNNCFRKDILTSIKGFANCFDIVKFLQSVSQAKICLS
jgi:hypothetical protein